MVILTALTLVMTVGYNNPINIPWVEDWPFNDPDQFRNVLVAATVYDGHLFGKYAHITGDDSYTKKTINGRWKDDNSETKGKNLLIGGVSYLWGGLRLFAGAGYLDHPDYIRLSGHYQFNLGLQYQIGDFEVGYEHFSNGRSIFGNDHPNIGIDFFTVGYRF